MSDDASEFADEAADDGVEPDSLITREWFLEWRAPRVGSANPEEMSNPVWEWLVKSNLDIYLANKRFEGPSSLEVGPGWCFQRFGQSDTELTDGRTVYVGGEHEDYYDPDFYIYNDVVVRDAKGEVRVYGYPHEVFPPTDFHSATLVGNRLVLIGSLGYPQARKVGVTQVLALALDSWVISAIETCGALPGWIHRHRATLVDEGAAILIQGGQVHREQPGISLVENIDDWKLHLADWRWERLTERRWPCWEVRRCDGQRNHLWEYQMAWWDRRIPSLKAARESAANSTSGLQLPSLEETLGGAPDLDLFERLYQPERPHEVLPEVEGEHEVHRVQVHGVVVRYTASMQAIRVTVEGELVHDVAAGLALELRDKLSALERAECEIVPISLGC